MSRADPIIEWTCDRCGVMESERSGSRPGGWVAFLPAQVQPRTDTTGLRWLDLCEACDLELTKWVKYDADPSRAVSKEVKG